MTRTFVLLLLAGCGTTGAEAAPLRVATFQSDVTPPIGHPLCGGWIKAAEVVDTPLLLKGIVLDDRRTRYVIAALDWCVLGTKAYDAFRDRIAKEVDIPRRQVTLHCTHTHSAPIADARAQELLDASPLTLPHLDLAWLARIADAAGAAAKGAVDRLRPFTHVGAGKAEVEKFASNRRVKGPDGKIVVRWSSTKDPFLKEAPEGRIDPWLRTVSLYDRETPLVRLHYYASHPQTRYGDGRVHGDVCGHARDYLEQEEGVFQIYFAGCGGDITAGKYNDGSPESKKKLASALYAGMLRAVGATVRTPVQDLEWRSVDVDLPLRTEPAFSEARYRKDLGDVAAPKQSRLIAAIVLAWIERAKAGPVDVSRLRLGPVDLLHLPGEPFVEYQLYAQSLNPSRFTAVAGYGEGGPWYLCTDAAYAEGGYEPADSWVGPPVEVVLKRSIQEALR